MPKRIIFHIDMDAFFTSVEQRENPRLAGKPVVVGADPKEGKGRGVVSTASYEARKYGVHSAQPITLAWRMCPKCVFLPVNWPLYEKVSQRIMAILRKYADKFESWGVDEAFLDVSQKAKSYTQAKKLAQKIKREIFMKEKLTCSIGIGPNKTIAKIASDFQKPDGLYLVAPDKVREFLAPQKVSKIPGIGPKSESILNSFGIYTISQLAGFPKKKLTMLFGKWGEEMYLRARGIDESPVVEVEEVKSIGHEYTFLKDTSNKDFIYKTLRKLCRDVWQELKEQKFKYKTLVVKIRYRNFETHTHQESFERSSNSLDEIQKRAIELIRSYLNGRKVRLIGIRLANLIKYSNMPQ